MKDQDQCILLKCMIVIGRLVERVSFFLTAVKLQFGLKNAAIEIFSRNTSCHVAVEMVCETFRMKKWKHYHFITNFSFYQFYFPVDPN